MAEVEVVGIGGGVWSPGSIESRPQIVATCWDIYEVYFNDEPQVTLHLVGVDSQRCQGIVSSPIQHIDAQARTVTTERGRQYLLSEGNGGNADSRYVWNTWRRQNAAIRHVVKTDEFLEKLAPYAAKVSSQAMKE